ncbi:MAG TPA: exopolysaccharide biosynthesis polyprenyl glycosylphosphotransferase [Myxococcaceae bacterium]|nr:exopolysaccharide biosynthesis polyprenyl glycosylphosphotransferase [Myxococcaceae bacterium]
MLRVFHHYVSARKLLFFAAETLSIALAGVLGAGALALVISPPGTSVPLDRTLLQLALYALALAAVFQLALYAVDLYDLRVAAEDLGGGGGARLVRAAGVAVFLLGLGAFALRVRAPTGVLLGGALGAVAGMMAVRAAMRAHLGQGARVFVLGDGIKARALARMIREGGEGAFELCGMVEPPREGAGEGEPAVDAQALEQRARYVVVALDEPRGGRWMDALFRCRLSGMQVYDAAGFSERVLRRLPVTHLRPAQLAFEERLTIGLARKVCKRVVDVLAASALLLLAAPLGLLVALAVKLDSKGPIFYAQERVGLGGTPYRLWKFRSMRQDAEKGGAVWARKNDDRVTRVGRFIRKCRIDELPQVYNVLRGDMSLVGPRPERPVFVAQLKQQVPFYGLRELVKPGVTGWAQIRYPYGASVEDARNKLELDLYYVKNGSLFLDLAIIFHTVRHVLMGRGAR